MGCAQSSTPNAFQDDAARARTEQIDAQLRKDRQAAKNEVKMLLLGAGESGKSTILKQMKILHHGGYHTKDRIFFREIIFSNIMQSIRTILEAMEELRIDHLPANDAYRELILNSPTSITSDTFPKDIYQAVDALAKDPGVQEAMVRNNEFQLNDSTSYYFCHLKRMAAKEYLPTDQDILRSRVKTTGITEVIFPVQTLTYKVFDVGGQRSERRKWIHCFDNLTAVIFLVALSEYDQVLREDENVNRMQESLALFESICNSRWFALSSMILFLNKMDILAQKLEKSPLQLYLPDYNGLPNYESACAYFRAIFVALNRSPSKPLYTHFTCATDTKQIKFVLAAMHDILVKANLREIGLL